MNPKITASTFYRASIACLAAAGLFSLAYYLLATKPLTNQAFTRQHQILKTNQKIIDNWWDDEIVTIHSDLNNPEIISRSLLILQARRQSRSTFTSPLSTGLRDELNGSLQNRNSVSLLTRGGIVVFSTTRQKLGMYQPLKNTTTSLELHELQTTPLNFFTDSESGLPSISVALPINDQEKIRRGFLAIDLNLNRLNSLIRIVPEQQSHGQRFQPPVHAYLAARTTLEHVTHIAPPNSQAHSAINPHHFEPLNSVGIQRALEGQSGQGLYLDPKSRPTVGVYEYLPTFRTALLVESLQRDVYMPARKQARIIFASGVLISVTLSLAGFLVSRRSKEPHVSV